MVVQSVNRWDKVQNSGKSYELMRSNILISSIVWCKVYSPNKPTPENSIKKLGPEKSLLAGKYGTIGQVTITNGLNNATVWLL